jgi:hypothetical protein
MKNWYPDLKRGEDPERDKRLDQYFGSLRIGPLIFKDSPEGGTLMGNKVTEYGYDGSVVREEDCYNVRLFWD